MRQTRLFSAFRRSRSRVEPTFEPFSARTTSPFWKPTWAAIELSALVAGHGVTVAETDAGERLDRRALANYRHRLREIDEELAEAQSWHDTGRVERVEAEREALLRELAGATGLGGRARTTSGAAERARVAVRKAIAAALDRIEADDAATARVLRRTVHTGSVCHYEPNPDAPVEWLL